MCLTSVGMVLDHKNENTKRNMHLKCFMGLKLASLYEESNLCIHGVFVAFIQWYPQGTA